MEFAAQNAAEHKVIDSMVDERSRGIPRNQIDIRKLVSELPQAVQHDPLKPKSINELLIPLPNSEKTNQVSPTPAAPNSNNAQPVQQLEFSFYNDINDKFPETPREVIIMFNNKLNNIQKDINQLYKLVEKIIDTSQQKKTNKHINQKVERDI